MSDPVASDTLALGWAGTSEKRVKDLWGVGGHSSVCFPDMGVRLSPQSNADCSGHNKKTSTARSHGKRHLQKCPHDRPLTVPRYILSTSLLPAQSFSRRNLLSYPASCHSPFSVGGRMGAGLPAAGTAGGAMLGHTSRGTACTRARWKHLLEHAAPLALGFPGKPWLPALQLECAAISGSPLGRGGLGDRVNLSIQLLSFGKKGKRQAQPGGSPAQGSTAACHRNLSCHKHGAIAAFQQRHAVGTPHICLEHQSYLWCRQVHGSSQHTAAHCS